MTTDIKISDYDYPLPDSRIAKHPLAQRDSCKLLRYSDGHITETTFAHLPELLPADAMLIYNNTRVINARMRFTKSSGASIEIFCLEPSEPADYAENFASRSGCSWLCFVGNSKRWKEGPLSTSVSIDGKDVCVTATREGRVGNASIVRFGWDDPDCTFASIIEAAGVIPIPPYLNRDTEESDSTDYQTVFSRIKGSVAAPTAGLHFTDSVLDAITRRGIPRRELTLHVGAGTFQPVKEEDVSRHEMHSEFISVPKALIAELAETRCRVYAVGTTSVRTLESLYHIGCLMHEGAWDGEVPQWYPYSATHPGLSVEQSLRTVLSHLEAKGLDRLVASTRIIISEGYNYRIVKGMITNFHQPKSTLLLLVSAFIGEKWREVYDYALKHDFRFLSYGDACLFEPQPRHDNSDENFPIVDGDGNTIGKATRGECHGGTKLLHPVVHLHVFNSQGDLYLQKRPDWKDIQPGKWDTATGGHIDYGETVEEALRREVREELGITDFEPAYLTRYVFESARERELVNVYTTVYDGDIRPSDELDGGRFWSREEIREAMGKGILTPNFEQEYTKYVADGKKF